MHRAAASIDHLEADDGPRLIGNIFHATKVWSSSLRRLSYSLRVVPSRLAQQQNWLESRALICGEQTTRVGVEHDAAQHHSGVAWVVVRATRKVTYAPTNLPRLRLYRSVYPPG